MKKRSKIYILILIVIILIVLCKSILTFDSMDYKLNIGGNKIKIKEFVNKNNYYFEIKTTKNIYPFRIYEDLKDRRKVVENIYYYKDKNIECVLPVINNNIYTDIECYKDGIIYNYYTIKGEYSSLDKYVDSIELYNINNYKDEKDNTKILGTIKYNVYDNISHSSVITTYKGLIINGEEINLFKKDIYNNKLSAFINNNYIIADYENKFVFNYFYIVDLNTGKISKLQVKNDISYDSYIQGVVDSKIYLYDKDNEIQYEIDIKEKKIKVVSDNNYIKYYTNKKWERMNKTKANKEIYFSYETLDNNFTTYDNVEETDNYFYLFKKDGIFYNLYRIDKNNINVYKYLIDVPTTNIYFNDNYLYYVYKNKLFYYSDITGFKTILENSELEFNDTIKYYIY